MPYTSKQHAVDTLAPGWRITGEQPNMVSVPNPRGGEYGQPAQIQEQQGTILTIDNPSVPNEQPDTIIIKQVGNAPWKGGVGYDVVQGPTRAQPKPDKAATPPSGLIRLDANYNVLTDPNAQATFIVDPAAPPGTAPYKIEPGKELGDPNKWEVRPADPNDADGPKLVYDPGSKAIIATIPATAGTRASGDYANIIDPNDPTGKRVIGMRDKGSNQIFPVSNNPALQKQVVSTPDNIYVLNDDGSLANTIKVDRTQPNQAVVVGGQVFAFNPNETDPTKQFVAGPEVSEPATVGLSTQNEWYIFFDKNGKEVSRVKNPSWRPDQTAAPPTSLTAPTIPRWNPQKGVWEDVPNVGRLTIGDVTQQMIKDLTGQTVDPKNPMTLEEANSVLTAAINKMNADAQKAATAAGAAQNILSTQAQGAQTGAGILAQRQATTQGLIQQGLNVATSTGGRYGNYSGGMLSPVPGLGQALVSGAANFATELGGGQAVFDTAVRMVQAADPNNQNPDRAAAVATLTQIMDRYKQSTGQDYPTVAATKALQASQQNGGLQPPQTVSPAAVAPEVFQAQFDPRLNPASPQQPQGTLLPPGVAGTVAPGDPRYLGIPPTVTQPRSAAELGFVAPWTGLARGPIQQMVG